MFWAPLSISVTNGGLKVKQFCSFRLFASWVYKWHSPDKQTKYYSECSDWLGTDGGREGEWLKTHKKTQKVAKRSF